MTEYVFKIDRISAGRLVFKVIDRYTDNYEEMCSFAKRKKIKYTDDDHPHDEFKFKQESDEIEFMGKFSMFIQAQEVDDHQWEC